MAPRVTALYMDTLQSVFTLCPPWNYSHLGVGLGVVDVLDGVKEVLLQHGLSVACERARSSVRAHREIYSLSARPAPCAASCFVRATRCFVHKGATPGDRIARGWTACSQDDFDVSERVEYVENLYDVGTVGAALEDRPR